MTDRIDAHQHFWRYSPSTHAWIDDSMRALQGDFLPDDLAPLLRSARLDGCVAVQAQQDVAETEWLLSLADRHAFIRGVVGWVDLRAGDVRDRLEALAAHPKLKGVRHVVQDEPDDRFMLGRDFMRGIAALAEFNLSYDILIRPRQLAAAAELVMAFPGQRFVLDHIAKPEIRERKMDEWARGIARLGARDNAWCKLSGMVTEARWSQWSASDFAPYAEVVLEHFGPRRLMFGSDWPVCTLAGNYGEVVDLGAHLIRDLSSVDQDAIMGGNAVAFYDL